MAPFLFQDLLSPETSSLPSLQAISASCEIICKREPRIIALSKAATMGVLHPPIQNPDGTLAPNWERIQQSTGSTVPEPLQKPSRPWHHYRRSFHFMETGHPRYYRSSSCSISREHHTSKNLFSALETPLRFKGLARSRGIKLQQTFSHIADTTNFASFVDTCSETSLVRTAIFCVKQNIFFQNPPYNSTQQTGTMLRQRWISMVSSRPPTSYTAQFQRYLSFILWLQIVHIDRKRKSLSIMQVQFKNSVPQ